MKINIIVSVSENWVIGKDNKLLWKLSNDLKRFKKITIGKPVIMGQKTFESLPNGALPERVNIVLTFDKNFNAPNIIPVFSIEEALDKVIECCSRDSEVFIIGGGMVYKQFLDISDTVYLTTVHTVVEGDTKFPELLKEQWELISEEFKEKDNKNEYDQTYKIYNRKY